MTVGMVVGVVVHESIFYDMEMKGTLVGGWMEANGASIIGRVDCPDC